MVTPVAPEIDSALDHPDPREAVERVKRVVQRRLLHVYPRARIIRTEFFNHSFAPDMLMTWDADERRVERRVYLRTSPDPMVLAADVMLLDQEQQPLVVPLASLTEGSDRNRLGAVAQERHTLILEPSGLGALPPHLDTHSVAALASDALVEGGRGVMADQQVDHFLAAIESGVGAARQGVTEHTRTALDEVARHTVPTTARRMSTFMAAMWQGSGRSLGDFPGDVPFRSSLDRTSLSLLLTSDEIDNEDFWRRIRPLVDVKTLLGTGIRDTANLQHFMRSVVRTWKGHVCMIVEDEPSSSQLGAPWRWALMDRRLGLRGPGFVAYIAGSRRNLGFPEDYPAPLLAQVRRRADRFSIPLTAIRMLVTNRSIGYDGPGDDVTHDPQLDGISAALGREEGVIETLALTPTGASLRCSFTSRTASPPGARTLLTYTDLLGTALRLLLDLSESDSEQLQRVIDADASDAPDWAQPGLFE
ncbi:hypothetical protein LO772_30195 [Yinghuangia sp. ASG 101]|uniref:hypothetical protein n=1 Tax=Yinghuangia sp. ASG 101 TaxID=2896848 RepID=UPI001E35431B|nr:hypothetical protein [Yinghuangia sp. ASG 101]UGQ11035.1 hypothetical protein LO772_30195 [Yinghuangia sp. ASG 101]